MCFAEADRSHPLDVRFRAGNLVAGTNAKGGRDAERFGGGGGGLWRHALAAPPFPRRRLLLLACSLLFPLRPEAHKPSTPTPPPSHTHPPLPTPYLYHSHISFLSCILARKKSQSKKRKKGKNNLGKQKKERAAEFFFLPSGKCKFRGFFFLSERFSKTL